MAELEPTSSRQEVDDTDSPQALVPPLVIVGDAKAPHEAVVTAMDTARELGFTALRIAVVRASDDGR